MKKKVLPVLLVAVMLLTCIPLGVASASVVYSGITGECVWTMDDEGNLIITGNGPMDDYIASYDSMPWGNIVQSVTIGDGVTHIGNYAFWNNNNIQWVSIGNSVVSIGERAFYSCRSLEEIKFPDSVTTIGDYAFYDCISLTALTIGNGVTTIGQGAFSWCDNIERLVLSDSVTTIGERAFSYCRCLRKVDMPDSIITVGKNAFERCISLSSVTIGSGVVTLGECAFAECFELSMITVEESNRNYCSVDGVLYSKDKKVLVQYPIGRSGNYAIPDSVSIIDDYAFHYCVDLYIVDIPSSVTTIGRSAFNHCDNLVKAIVPESVVTIGDYAFGYCKNLKEVNIPRGTTFIGTGAFKICEKIEEITIPNGITIIREDTFRGCTSLTSVSIPQCVSIIEDCAFYYCTGLSDVYYSGSQEDRYDINMGVDNYHLYTNTVTWHYNTAPNSLYSKNIQHSVMDTENGYGLAFRFELAAKGVEIGQKNVVSLTNTTVNYLGEDCKLVGMGAVVTNDVAVGATEFSLDDINGNNVLDVPTVYLQDADEDSCAFATRIINIPGQALDRTIYVRPYCIIEVDGEQITVYGDVDSATCTEYL